MVYSIGGMPVEIDFKHEYGKIKCQRFEVNTPALFSVCATDEEIAKESLSNSWNKGISEFECIFKKIYNQSPNYNRIVMHGASVEVNGDGFIFTAPSGTGKSTHIKLWGKMLKEKVTIIDGDKPFVGFENNIPTVWGSPRSGKESWSNPISADIKGIAFLEQSENNEIKRVSPNEIIDKAFMQFYIPKNKETAEKTIILINDLLKTVPLYVLKCNMDIKAAEIAYEEMSKN